MMQSKLSSNLMFCFVIAVIFLINMSGTTLPTAVYPFYQSQSHITSAQITFIYALYVTGVITVLWLIGNWSNFLGRKPFLYLGLFSSATSALIFMYSDSLTLWLIARVLSGFSAGLFISTATITILELFPEHLKKYATLLISASNMLGLGLGPLIGGYVVDYLPNPTHTPYFIHFCLVLMSMLLLWFCPETVIKKNHPLKLSVLKHPQKKYYFLSYVSLLGFASFMMMGFYCSITPSLIHHLFHISNNVLVGWIVFTLFFSSFIGQLLDPLVHPNKKLLIGAIGLSLGLLGFALSIISGSLILLLIATILCGLAQGLIFKVCLSIINKYTDKNDITTVNAIFFIVNYIGMSIPVIIIGLIIKYTGLGVGTLIYCTVTMLVLAYSLYLSRKSTK